MEIQRVVSDLVTTHRHPWLDTLSLRVVEDYRGQIEVAVDPIGCKPGDFVITIGVSAARIAAGDKRIVTDCTIGGIIDYWDVERWSVPRPAPVPTPQSDRPAEARPEGMTTPANPPASRSMTDGN
jgi:carboxysome peptide B